MNFLTILFPLLLIITTAYSSPVADKKDSGPAVADAVPLSEQQKKQIKDAIESAPVVQEIPITGELAETIKKLYQSRGGVVAENEEPETEEYVTGEYESGSYEAQESAENGTAPVIPHKPLKIRRSGPMPQGKPIRVVAAGPGRQMTQVIQTRFINGKPQFRVVTRTKNTAITDTASVIAGASKDIANLISGAVQTGADGWTTINEAASNVISKAAGLRFGTATEERRAPFRVVPKTDEDGSPLKFVWPNAMQQAYAGLTQKRRTHYSSDLKVEIAGSGSTPGTVTNHNGDVVKFVIPSGLKSREYIPGLDPGSIVVVESAGSGTTPGVETNSDGEPLKVVLPSAEGYERVTPSRQVYYRDTVHVEAAEAGTTPGTVTDDLGYVVKFLVPRETLITPGYIRGPHGSAIEVGPAGPGTAPGLVVDAVGEPMNIYLSTEHRDEETHIRVKIKRKHIRVVDLNESGSMSRDVGSMSRDVGSMSRDAFKTSVNILGKNGAEILKRTASPGTTTDLHATTESRVSKKKIPHTHPVYIIPEGEDCSPGTVTDKDGDYEQFIVPHEAYRTRGYIPGLDGQLIIAEPVKPGTTPGIVTDEIGRPVHLYLPASYQSEAPLDPENINVKKITESPGKGKCPLVNDVTTQRSTSELPSTQLQQTLKPTSEKEHPESSELEVEDQRHFVILPQQYDEMPEPASDVTPGDFRKSEKPSDPTQSVPSKTTSVHPTQSIHPEPEKISSNRNEPNPMISPNKLEDLKQVADNGQSVYSQLFASDAPTSTSSKTTEARTSTSSRTTEARTSTTSGTTEARTSTTSGTTEVRTSTTSGTTEARTSTATATTTNKDLLNMQHSERPLRKVQIMPAGPGTTPGVVTGEDGTIDKVFVPLGAFLTPGYIPGKDGKPLYIEPVKPGSTPGFVKGAGGELEKIVLYSTTTQAPK